MEGKWDETTSRRYSNQNKWYRNWLLMLFACGCLFLLYHNFAWYEIADKQPTAIAFLSTAAFGFQPNGPLTFKEEDYITQGAIVDAYIDWHSSQSIKKGCEDRRVIVWRHFSQDLEQMMYTLLSDLIIGMSFGNLLLVDNGPNGDLSDVFDLPFTISNLDTALRNGFICHDDFTTVTFTDKSLWPKNFSETGYPLVYGPEEFYKKWEQVKESSYPEVFSKGLMIEGYNWIWPKDKLSYFFSMHNDLFTTVPIFYDRMLRPSRKVLDIIKPLLYVYQRSYVVGMHIAMGTDKARSLSPEDVNRFMHCFRKVKARKKHLFLVTDSEEVHKRFSKKYKSSLLFVPHTDSSSLNTNPLVSAFAKHYLLHFASTAFTTAGVSFGDSARAGSEYYNIQDSACDTPDHAACLPTTALRSPNFC